MTEKYYAIYSRKSKYTGHGESTTNQIEICMQALKNKFPDILESEIIFYEDEGFSGYNINRPSFKKLLTDIENDKIKVLLFYKLDRISRNVSDFAKLMHLLETHQVLFSSATENIETLTPSGKALTYMISVFAELERNTIAERIKDNMLELAKSGVWLGGNPPTGYSSSEIITKSLSGKKKKIYCLKANDEIDKVKLIFENYLRLKSLTKLETYLLNKKIVSKNKKAYSRFALKNILSNPVYVKSDQDIYNYYKNEGACLYGETWNKKFGLMVYNKTTNNKKKITRKDIKDWIISVGMHYGIIDGQTFISVIKLMENNKIMRYRKTDDNKSILSGLIKCNTCNTNMRPKIRRNKDNEIITDYICELKEKSKRKLCNQSNINGSILENSIISHLMAFNININSLLDKLKKALKKRPHNELNDTINKIKENEALIKGLITKIKYLDISLLQDINQEIKDLKSENEKLKIKLNTLKTKTIDYKNIANDILLNYKNFYLLDTKSQKKYMHLLIDKIVADKNSATIFFK